MQNGQRNGMRCRHGESGAAGLGLPRGASASRQHPALLGRQAGGQGQQHKAGIKGPIIKTLAGALGSKQGGPGHRLSLAALAAAWTQAGKQARLNWLDGRIEAAWINTPRVTKTTSEQRSARGLAAGRAAAAAAGTLVVGLAAGAAAGRVRGRGLRHLYGLVDGGEAQAGGGTGEAHLRGRKATESLQSCAALYPRGNLQCRGS